MAVFQVTSRRVRLPVPPQKHVRRISERWATLIRVLGSMSASALLFVLLLDTLHNSYTFILLPTFLSFFIIGPVRLGSFTIGLLMYGPRRLVHTIALNATPLYLLFTFGLALLYYALITGVVLFLHPPGADRADRIILVTTALGWAIILELPRNYLQALIERRFNTRNREVVKAVESFTSTLREEIELGQIRTRFLAVVQQTVHPYHVSLWVRAAAQPQEPPATTEQVEEPIIEEQSIRTIANDDPLLAYALHHPGVTEIARLHLDSPLLRDLQQQGAEWLLPFVSQGELIGLLVPGLRIDGEDYTRAERALLNTLAPQVAPALRVALMVQEEQEQVRERERIEQELRTARQIQHTFLPKEVPSLPGWRLIPYYQPAREVGGDFYDFLAFEDGRLAIVIGDVTGKGIPAALMMTATRTMLRTATRESSSPSQVLARVNELLVDDIPPSMFVTCFYAILDPRSGHLRYANAGHDWPYQRRHTGIMPLQATGMPLGMMPESCYEEGEGTLEPGDSLLFFSDGLVEAHNAQRQMFGLPRLRSIIAAHADGTTLIEILLSHLASFTGTPWEQEDDVTMIALHRESR